MISPRAAMPVALATALLGVLLLPSPASAAGGTVYVDDDWTGTAPGADPDGAGPATAFGADAFATIPDALAVAPDRIRLAAGDYAGQLVLDADVEIVGAGEGMTFLSAPAGPAGYLSYWGVNAIVVVDAADVVIGGVTVRGPQPGVGQMAGIVIGGGGSLDLSASTVRAIRDDPFSGAQRGNAVVVGASGGATTGTATLSHVLVTDYQKTGIVVRPGSTGVIEDSVVQGRGPQCVNGSNGIQLQGTATVRRTIVRDNRYADAPGTPGCGGGPADAFGIGVFSPTGPVVIEDSEISGTELGVYLSAATGVGPALTITGSTITGLLDDATGNPLADGSWGVYSDWGRPGAVIGDNVIRRTDAALVLAGGTEDVTSNTLRDNAVGVRLEATPVRLAANSIVGNTVGAESSGSTTGGPNWWGCNAGPGGAGCDGVTGGYAEPSWLVLSLRVDACQVTAGADVAAVARLTTTSDDTEYTSATVPPTTVTFTSNGRIAVAPGSGTTADGALPVMLHGVAPGDASADARADNGVASAPGDSCAALRVLAAAPAQLPATGSGADAGTGALGAAAALGAGSALLLLVGLARARERRRRRDYARSDV